MEPLNSPEVQPAPQRPPLVLPAFLPLTFEHGEVVMEGPGTQEKRLGMEVDKLTYNSSETD